jgi:hypothetical protein
VRNETPREFEFAGRAFFLVDLMAFTASPVGIGG